MKICPSCHTQYTDNTLMFCLQDGTPLDAAFSSEPSTTWSGDDELETAVRAKYPTQPGTAQSAESEGPHVPPQRASRSKTPFIVVATAVATLLILGILGLGAWLYFRKDSETTRNTSNGRANQNSSAANANSTRTPTPTPSPSPTPANNNSASPTPTPEPAADKEVASREVAEQIGKWELLSESGDLDAYMSKYAGTVDYYQRRGASVEFVRRDKRRAFGMYDSISFDISNMDVRVDDSGDRAVATFDKEWEFEGEESRSTGKVKQQLELRKISGEWLITGERDLRVY